MTGSHALPKYAFFLSLALLLFLWGQIGLPVAHYFYDAVAIRDTGVFMADMAGKPDPVSSFVTMAFRHHEGLIQFVLLNLYCFFVGDSLPLDPSTMQLPNTVLAFFAAVLCFLMAKKMISTRFAYCSAAVFVLGPWLAYTIRLPWYFDTLSCLLHFSTFYFLAAFMMDPQSTLSKVAAPASFSLYLLSSLDWPSFVPCLIFFILMSGQFGRTLRNPFNLLPALVVGLLIFWQIFLYLKVGKPTLGFSRAIYPFWSFLEYINVNSLQKIWDNVVLPWGPQMLLAGIGAGLYLTRLRSLWLTDRVRRAFFDSMCLWILGATPALFVSAGSATYLYVLAMPSALLSGLVLARMRYQLLIPCVVALAISQAYFVTDKQFAFVGDKKQRVLAAACYLIEQRPDLLTEARTPVVAGFDAAAVTQYTRRRNVSIVVGADFPVEYDAVKAECLAVGQCSVRDLAGQKRNLVNPWFVLDSSPLTDRNPYKNYWIGLLQDPSIKWIAQFREPTGEVIYIGEPQTGSHLSAHAAPAKDVNSLADEYLKKYDRLSFLKKNLEYVYHY
ncbi:MAG: hypothetical protein HY913_05655 [Desulfomonile tiedjei]|nr:hypothetical protein [Desulfomonile tiedjei]